MKEIEKRTEKIARYLAKEAGYPEAMGELFLGKAYELVYFGDISELERVESKILKRKRAREEDGREGA